MPVSPIGVSLYGLESRRYAVLAIDSYYPDELLSMSPDCAPPKRVNTSHWGSVVA